MRALPRRIGCLKRVSVSRQLGSGQVAARENETGRECWIDKGEWLLENGLLDQTLCESGSAVGRVNEGDCGLSERHGGSEHLLESIFLYAITCLLLLPLSLQRDCQFAELQMLHCRNF
jgi:hypothetical protein